MVIINPQVPIQPAAFNRPAGPAPILAADKVLMAVVLSQKANHMYELASGSLRMMAESQTPLKQGEQLQLRVTGHDASQRPQLEILNRNSVQLLPLIKASLPQQENLNQLSSSLLANLRGGTTPQLQNATAQFFTSLPERSQMTNPQSLNVVLQNSGLFLESHLARGQAVTGDIKTALLKLARQLEAASQLNSRPGAMAANSGADSAKPNASTAQTTAHANSQPSKTLADKAGIEAQLTAGLKDTGPLKTTLAQSTNQTATPTASGEAGKTQTQAQANTAAKSPLPNELLSTTVKLTTPSSRAASAYQTTQAALPSSNVSLPGDIQAQARIPLNQAEILKHPDTSNQQLLNMVRGVLARGEAHQLLHLQTADPQQQQYVMEIPVRDRDGIDVWQMRLERRDLEDQASAKSRTDPDKAKHQWTVTLNFDFPGMGPVKAVLRQQNEKMKVDFTAENAATDAAIKQFQGELTQRLQEQGINDIQVSSKQGSSAENNSPLHQLHLLKDQA
ncbi:flagellar hook-length control protein FliK [Spongiibacter sp. KMU-158]|uniref:Flagellar hook-length control protein FliK n=1 Tax=Spongiibacter pelagi TaxID=2760804 RepID=A0A927GVS1_9GAMM|nr:flagellar hook-length control protein FliK [Spongiibacter pelagi]MBD2858961.1 flagellar hook-length control protein FliK [Spongiibacter pelagi]